MTTWMPVLVRREDYGEITALVAAREAEHANSDVLTVELGTLDSTPAAGDEARLAIRESWSLEDLGRLAAGKTLTTQRWTQAMDACTLARESGEIWIPTSEVARRTGMSINEWRDAPRKITRHLRVEHPTVPRIRTRTRGGRWLREVTTSRRTAARCGGPSPRRWPNWREVRGDSLGRFDD